MRESSASASLARQRDYASFSIASFLDILATDISDLKNQITGLGV
jgi:hypothetical protein